jgi:hypothetical protein
MSKMENYEVTTSEYVPASSVFHLEENGNR